MVEPQKLRRKPKERLHERIIRQLLFLSAALSVFTMLAILGTLLFQALSFFQEVSIIEFLTETRWTPLFQPQYFGILPLITGTLLVAAIALLVAVPIGLGTAIFLSEYAPDSVRRSVKPVLEILAGIPTVVYGYFAITYVTPQLQGIFGNLTVFNALSAGLVMGLMIIPMVSSLSEDAMVAVPRLLREGAYALGAKKFEVAIRVVLPAAISGVIASIILAMSRAIGETMIVSIAAGSTPRLTLNPLVSIQTMTAFITQLSLGETPFGSLEYRTIFAVGITLFIMVLAINLVGDWIKRRYWERY
ncbi:MAG: phosphate ABC transporter permease subunit PstC [Nitrososphaerales archaeon]